LAHCAAGFLFLFLLGKGSNRKWITSEKEEAQSENNTAHWVERGSKKSNDKSFS